MKKNNLIAIIIFLSIGQLKVSAGASNETHIGYKNYKCIPKESSVVNEAQFIGGALQITNADIGKKQALFQGIVQNFEPNSKLILNAKEERLVFGSLVRDNDKDIKKIINELNISPDSPFWRVLQEYWDKGGFGTAGSSLSPVDKIKQRPIPRDQEVLVIQPMDGSDLLSGLKNSAFLRILNNYSGTFKERKDAFIEGIMNDQIDNFDELIDDANFWFDLTFSYAGYLFIPKKMESEDYPESFDTQLYLKAGGWHSDFDPENLDWHQSEIQLEVHCQRKAKVDVQDIVATFVLSTENDKSKSSKKKDSSEVDKENDESSETGINLPPTDDNVVVLPVSKNTVLSDNYLSPQSIHGFISYWLLLSNSQKSVLLNKVTRKIQKIDNAKLATVGALTVAGVWASIKMASRKIPIIGLAAIATSAQATPDNCINPQLIPNLLELSTPQLISCLQSSKKLNREFKILIQEIRITK